MDSRARRMSSAQRVRSALPCSVNVVGIGKVNIPLDVGVAVTRFQLSADGADPNEVQPGRQLKGSREARRRWREPELDTRTSGGINPHGKYSRRSDETLGTTMVCLLPIIVRSNL